MRWNHRALIAVALGTCGLAACAIAAPASQPAVATDALLIPRHPTLVPGSHVIAAILVRELGRQAIVIAAERAGVPIIDATLTPHAIAGPHAPTTVPSAHVLDVVSRCYEQHPYECIVSIGDKPLDQFTVPCDPDPENHIVPYAALVEQLATRIDGEYAQVMQAQFGGHAPLPFDPEGDAPPEVESLLTRPDAVSAFHAARLTLRAIATQGESPPRLCALARAYANLGESTRCLLGGQFDVFFARALLYAQRLANAAPADPHTRWTQAYVDALIGLHLDARAALTQAFDSGSDQPDWADIVQPLLDEDSVELDRIARETPAIAPLAAHAEVRTVEFSDVDSIVWPAAERAYALDPSNLRAMLVANDHENLSVQGDLADRMPPAMSNAFAAVEAWPDLPADLRQRFEAARTAGYDAFARLGLWQALDASITGEHSADSLPWAALGELSREVALVLAQRELAYRTDMLGVGCEDTFQEWSPLIEDSAWAPILASYAHSVPAQTLAACDTQDEHTNAEALAVRLRRKFKVIQHPEGDRRTERLFWQMDRTAYDTAESLYAARHSSDTAWVADTARHLRAQSSASVLATSLLIATAWPEIESHVAELEQAAESHPDIAIALARRLAAEGDSDGAQRIVHDALHRAQLAELYQALADAYREVGDVEHEVEAYTDLIANTPDRGLSHTSAQVAIAQALLRAGHPRRALPYAEAAGGAYSWEGLDVQAETYARLGQLDEADHVRHAIADRYGDAYADDAFYHGLLYAHPAGGGYDARFRALAKDWEDSKNAAHQGERLCIAFADNDLATAERMLVKEGQDESHFVGQHDELAAIHLWQNREADARATLAHATATTLPTHNAAFHRGIAKVALDILDGKPPPTPKTDRKLVELARNVTTLAQAGDAVLLGACCEHVGQRDTAIAWYRLSIRVGTGGADRIAAATRLRGMNVDPFAEEP